YSETKTFTKKATAKAWAAEREEQIRRDPAAAKTRAEHQGVTVATLIEHYLKARETVAPLGRSKGAHLRMLLGFDLARCAALTLTAQQVVEHIQGRRAGGTGGATVANDLIWRRVVFRYARTALGVPVDPHVLDDASEICRAERMITRPQRRKRRPTDDELTRIAERFRSLRLRSRRNPGPPMDLILWAAIYSCRRLDELCRMRLSDFDREHRTWMIRDLKHPDGSAGNDREMLVTDRFLAVVDAILALPGRDPDEDRLLPYNSKTVGTYWQRQLKVLGVVDLHFHDLRREGCSRLAEAGMTIPEIQRVSLHDSWSSLQIYVNMGKKSRVEMTIND
ncbi:tyrosine-type recombinase/integrase, partial [Lamprocystis purpurea]|uniref:tyrosine-type recombinase/integrase n=1 Tax=Lamprocystis purpurea TaxID=61598 RepID=UPI00037685B9